MGNVKAIPTHPDGEQGWKCQVCGKYFSYSQPINFQLASAMGMLFCEWHDEHCKVPARGEEVAGG